jgi:hypothetical protein
LRFKGSPRLTYWSESCWSRVKVDAVQSPRIEKNYANRLSQNCINTKRSLKGVTILEGTTARRNTILFPLTLSALRFTFHQRSLSMLPTAIEDAKSSDPTRTIEKDMAARLRLFLTAAMTTFRGSRREIPTMSPSEESFRFLDLPTELRCMIYEYLTHDTKIKIPDLGLPGCTTDNAWVEECFCAPIMLVCQQMRSEYTAVTTPTMRLLVCIGSYGVDEIRERPQSSQKHLPVLPGNVLAQITRLDIRVFTGCGGWPHCGMLSSGRNGFTTFLILTYGIDYLPTVQNLLSRMTRLSQATYNVSFHIDQLVEEELDRPTELDNYRAWIDRSSNFFPTMTCESTCWLRVGHEIRCDLFCVLPGNDTPGPTSEVIFGVCMTPEEGTFKLHNLDLKFMGEEEFGDGDAWWHEAGDEEEDDD